MSKTPDERIVRVDNPKINCKINILNINQNISQGFSQ